LPSAQVAQGGRGSMIALIGKKKSHAEKANAVTTQIPGGAIMPHYLIRGRMSRASVSAIVKNPQNRTEAAGAIISAAGGRLGPPCTVARNVPPPGRALRAGTVGRPSTGR